MEHTVKAQQKGENAGLLDSSLLPITLTPNLMEYSTDLAICLRLLDCVGDQGNWGNVLVAEDNFNDESNLQSELVFTYFI